jgi:hypothetical protein
VELVVVRASWPGHPRKLKKKREEERVKYPSKVSIYENIQTCFYLMTTQDPKRQKKSEGFFFFFFFDARHLLAACKNKGVPCNMDCHARNTWPVFSFQVS